MWKTDEKEEEVKGADAFRVFQKGEESPGQRQGCEPRRRRRCQLLGVEHVQRCLSGGYVVCGPLIGDDHGTHKENPRE